MKRILLTVLMFGLLLETKSQVTTIEGDYKIIDIGGNGYGDYTRSLILLHEVYNGEPLHHNYAIGTITAMRGAAVAGDRINVVNVNTSSSHILISGAITSYNRDNFWELKTCMYLGKKYMAVDVPYAPPYHNWGFKFSGATTSTGENMLCVSYQVNGNPVNQDLLTDIQNYTPNMNEFHDVASMNITGNVGIGTRSPNEKLSVNGNIRAREIKVETSNWPDYVFQPNYDLLKLSEVKAFINQHHHLPDLPSAVQVEKEGINLGEINAKLLKKIEELTLYLIEKDGEIKQQEQNSKRMEIQLNEILKKLK